MDPLDGLIPESPTALRRAYVALRIREAPPGVGISPDALRRTQALDLALLILGPLMLGALDPDRFPTPMMATLAGILAAACIVLSSSVRVDFGIARDGPVGFGLFSLAALYRKAGGLRRWAERDACEITPEMIETVARAAAAPILMRARRPQAPENLATLESINLRIAELRRDKAHESDETWRAAIEARLQALDEDRREVERVHQQRAALAARITSEADALEAALDRMSRRTRLLRELAEDREEKAEATAPHVDHLADLRARLADLGKTLQAHNEIARPRAAAELEMAEIDLKKP